MHLSHPGTSSTADIDIDVFQAATVLNSVTGQRSSRRGQPDARAAARGLITNPQENITYLHDKVRAAYNHFRDDLPRQDCRSLNPSDHTQHCFADLWTSIAQGKVWKGEFRNRARDGGLFWVDSTIIPFLSDDGGPQYVVIRAEISGREPAAADAKALDPHLLEQQSYARALVDSDLDAVMAIDAGGIITDANSKMELLTGRSRDELVGAPFRHRLTDPARAQANFNRLRSDAEPGNRDPGSGPRHYALHVVSYHTSSSHDRDNVLQGVLAAARDVTEQKCCEDALLQRNLELEIANRRKSEFLLNLSHELRTRLNSIIGFSEVLKDGLVGAMTARQLERVRAMLEIGRHALSLADDIHDLSRVEAGKMTLALEAVDMALLCESTVSLIRERAESRHIRLDIDVPAKLEPIQADRRKCKQILLNLLSNAIKFTSYGGKVTLRVCHARRAEIGRPSGSWTRRGFDLADNGCAEFVEISVTDSGIGISPQSINRLFEPFTQIDSGQVRRVEGTGLGLANVKLFADLHGGSVAVESALGEGSRFAVWLPVRAANEQAPPRARPTARPRTDAVVRPRIALVVEDDRIAAERIGVQLEAVGYTVLYAASGEQRIRVAGWKGYLARPMRYREFLPSIECKLVAIESGIRRG